ncbi:hypothetical protein J1N35_045197 [Gossypium stocksii]|uniref:Zinc/iron permease n=1 Tax=Gossypium stocksii TaxID=47602 RepID=A0A9D3ZH61_9ROSI|nr:hypothetical protein J1N35_045197 [Gossypium stocksii]
MPNTQRVESGPNTLKVVDNADGYRCRATRDDIIWSVGDEEVRLTDRDGEERQRPTDRDVEEERTTVKSMMRVKRRENVLRDKNRCLVLPFGVRRHCIGVAETEADAWKTLWIISLHKIFAAIAMGIALFRMIPDRPFLSCIAYVFAFAISSPAGVAIGIILDATTEGVMADWIFAISMGLACGVFIYVSINHLLSIGYTPHKTVSVDKPHYMFLAVLLGVGVIAVVMVWDN